MRKYIQFILYVITLSVISQACTKALEENPKSKINGKQFFTSVASYQQAVEGIYSSIPGLFAGRPMMMREMFSDIYGTPSSSYEQALPVYQNNHQDFFYCVRDEWSNDYTIIKNANYALDNINVATLLSEDQKRALSAEAKFLRAFAYFQLVQFYGAVPLPLKVADNYDSLQLPRSAETEVYASIVSDLKYGESYLPDKAVTEGRVYKLVATALLSKVYLTMAGNPLNQTKYYKDARDKAIEVINSNRFTLVADYKNVFHNKGYTTESIWEQLFLPRPQGGNGLQGISSTYPGFNPILLPAKWFIKSFDLGDQRKEWGISQNYITQDKKTLAPFFRKFVDTTFIDLGYNPSQAGQLDYSIPILRLAEMYLIAAEAENELNGPANAYQYINQVRKRARVDKNNPADVPDLAGLTKAQFRDSVLMERKHELYMEGSAWFDLKRTNTLKRINTFTESTLSHPVGDYNNTWYIPDIEIAGNQIEQNPSYE